MINKYKILDKLEYILGAIAAIALLLFVFLNMSAELQDPDIWLHIKTGEYIVQHKAVPKADIFSFSIPNKPWIDHSWLVQVIFYLAFHFGGADNLIFLSAMVVTFAFLFLFLSVYRQRQHLILIVAMLFMAIMASRIRLNIRPENFSILFFSSYLFILTKQINKKGVFLLPLIQLAWVNAHGFFILGPLMAGVFLLAECLKRSGLLPWEWGKAELLDENSYRNLAWVFVSVCLVSFINPYGYKGALYPLWVTSNSIIGKSSLFYKYIEELLPTWWFYKTVSTYYVFIALSFGVFLLNFRRVNLAHLILWLILLGISLKVNRNVIFFNFFAFLTTTEGLIKSANIKKPNSVEGFLEKPKYPFIYLLKFAIVAILIFWAIDKDNYILGRRYYIFDENRTKSALLGIANNKFPEKAADFILKNDLPQNIFNKFNYGSYLIYRFFPKKKVFIDGRTELYGDNFFREYKRVLAINKDAAEDVIKKYDINTVLLSQISFDAGNLSNYFFNNPAWALVYFDENSLIFLKDTPQNKMLIGRLKVDLKKWRTKKADLEKIGLKNVYPQPYVDRAWIFYYLGLNEQALSEAKEALRIKPSIPEAYNIIGRIYIKQKLYPIAFETLRLASIYGPSDSETFISLGSFYTETGKLDDAIKMYSKLTKIYPYDTEGFHLLSQAYNRVKNTKLAISTLRSTLKLDPIDPSYYKELGELLYKANDLKGAAGVYKDALGFGLDKTEFSKRLNEIRNKIETKK